MSEGEDQRVTSSSGTEDTCPPENAHNLSAIVESPRNKSSPLMADDGLAERAESPAAEEVTEKESTVCDEAGKESGPGEAVAKDDVTEGVAESTDAAGEENKVAAEESSTEEDADGDAGSTEDGSGKENGGG